jgi:hypothetical protein
VPGFEASSGHLRFVVNKVVLEQAFITIIYHPGMVQ